MLSQALEGRHNTAQGVNPVYGISPQINLLPRTPSACGGGGVRIWTQEIGLTPNPMLCRPSRAKALFVFYLEVELALDTLAIDAELDIDEILLVTKTVFPFSPLPRAPLAQGGEGMRLCRPRGAK